MAIMVGLFSSIGGFFIALYIYSKQSVQKPLMCPRKAPCDTVLSSPEATTFGLSNSLLGMVYYATALFLITCLGAGRESSTVEILLGLLTLGGFGFSAYLVWVQHYRIKQWCVWCLGSALMATVLFFAAVLLIF